LEIPDLIAPDRVIIGVKAASKSHLLAELARRAAAATGLTPKQIADVLEARESLGSTGVGAGLAIPHAHVASLDHFYGLFVRLDRPIDYDAIDGRPVDLVFLLLIPGNTRDHLAALAAISRCLRDREIENDLRSAKSSREAYDVLTRAR
jgi:PTS system nitrogen regulatory IIA component